MRIDNSIFDAFFGVVDGGGGSCSNSNTQNHHKHHKREQQRQHSIISPQPPSPTMSKRRKAKYYTRPVFKEPASMDEYLQLQRQRQCQHQRHLAGGGARVVGEQQEESRSDSVAADNNDHNSRLLDHHRQHHQDYHPGIVESLRRPTSIIEEIFSFGGDEPVDLQDVIDPSSSERISRLQRLVGRPTALKKSSSVSTSSTATTTTAAARFAKQRYSALTNDIPMHYHTHHPMVTGPSLSHRRSLYHRPVSMPTSLHDDDNDDDYGEEGGGWYGAQSHSQFHRYDHHHHPPRHRDEIIDLPDDITECGSSIVSASDLDVLASKALRGSRDPGDSTTKQLSENDRQRPSQSIWIFDYFSSLCTGMGQQEQRDDLAVIREEIAGIIDDERDELETNVFGGCISTNGWL